MSSDIKGSGVDNPTEVELEELDSTTLSTQPAPPRVVSLGLGGWLRWGWRQLTSMRTALFLLFLLAVAAVPGSVFPQRGSDPAGVARYFAAHPVLAPWLDRFSLFDVFGSPWFSAVYLLLFVSLVGCVIPRTLMHLRAMRSRPPAAPRNLARLPEHRSYVTASTPEQVVESARAALRGSRWRVDTTPTTVAAERGYLRETGNLVFHVALVGLLVAVAVGNLFGSHGGVVVVEGGGFSNTLTQYDSFGAGRLADVEGLPPFSFTMTDFTATYERGGPQDGAPRSFSADLLVKDTPDSAPRPVTVRVNEPLQVGGTKVFLIGHGYAPHVTVRDGKGRVVLSAAVPFLPRDGKFLSEGAVKAPDARPTQLGFRGVFLPTAHFDPVLGGESTFPAADDPQLLLTLFTGDLGLDTGTAQSVYALDTSRMTMVDGRALLVGDRWTLPDGLGSVTFDGVEEFASFSIARDPGTTPAFVASMLALAGLMLSLFVRRRRVWVRATAQADGRTLVAVGGLARAEAGSLAGEVDTLLDRLRADVPEEDPR